MLMRPPKVQDRAGGGKERHREEGGLDQLSLSCHISMQNFQNIMKECFQSRKTEHNWFTCKTFKILNSLTEI